MKKATKSKEPAKKKRRLSPTVLITLPPLTRLEGRRQAQARGITFSRHVANLIDHDSVSPY